MKKVQDIMNILVDKKSEQEMENEIGKIRFIHDNRIVAWDITICDNQALQKCPSWDYKKDTLQTRLKNFEKRFPKAMGVTGMSYFSYLTMLLDSVYMGEDVPDYLFTGKGSSQCFGTILNGSLNPLKATALPIAEANDMGPRPLFWISERETSEILEHLNFRPSVCLRYK